MGSDAAACRLGRRWLAFVVAWPLLLLLPCLLGLRTFLPYDTAQYPPASLLRSPAELAAMRQESNYDVTEGPVWFVPELKRARRSLLEEGSLPNWNSYARTGTALMPHGHDGLLYPFLWPALAFADPARWLPWLALLNLATAGLLTLGFLRRLGLAAPAAAFGAIAFSMSSALCANAHNFPRLSSLVWLPGMLWALKAWSLHAPRAALRPLAGFAACFALSWLGGFPPYALPASCIALAYAVSLLVQHARQHGLAATLPRALQFAMGGAVGVLLCSHYLLPAFSFFGQSARSLAPDLDRISQSAFDAYGLLGYLANDLFGRPDLGSSLPYGNAPLPLLLGNRTSSLGEPLLPNFNSTEYALYGSALSLWLAVLSLCVRGEGRVLPLVLWLGCVGMALFAWPFSLLFSLPGVRIVPPLRWLGPCAFLLAWMAARGLDAAWKGKDARAPLAASAIALLAALAAGWFWLRFSDPECFRQWGLAEQLAQRYAAAAPDPASITTERIEQLVLRSPSGADYTHAGAALAAAAAGRAVWLHLAAALLLGLLPMARRRDPRLLALAVGGALAVVGSDLWLAGRTFDRGIARPASDWTEVHDFLQQQAAQRAHEGSFMVARAAKVPDPMAPPEPNMLPPGTLSPMSVRDLQVYSYFDSRSLVPWGRLLSAVWGETAGLGATQKGYLTAPLPDDARVLDHPLLDLCGVRYVLASEPLQHAGPRVGPRIAGPGGEFFVYERASALPRAFVAHAVAAHDDDEALLAAMLDPAFSPRRTALALRSDLDATLGAARWQPLAATPGSPTPAERQVRFVRDEADAIQLEVAAGAPGMLSLADTCLPGWSASIDGAPVPIVRLNHFARGVPLGPQQATVEFRYSAPGQRLGFALFAAGLLLLLLLLRLARAR